MSKKNNNDDIEYHLGKKKWMNESKDRHFFFSAILLWADSSKLFHSFRQWTPTCRKLIDTWKHHFEFCENEAMFQSLDNSDATNGANWVLNLFEIFRFHLSVQRISVSFVLMMVIRFISCVFAFLSVYCVSLHFLLVLMLAYL